MLYERLHEYETMNVSIRDREDEIRSLKGMLELKNKEKEELLVRINEIHKTT